MDAIELPFPHPNHGTLPEKALRVPAEMVLQIASGLDTPVDIALRYGFSEAEFTALQAWTPFVQEVAKVRAELEKTGFDFTLDARLKAKELSNVIFLRAMGNDATFSQVHDAFRTFTELGDLRPKTPAQIAAAPGSSGFSINIVLNPNLPQPRLHPNSPTTGQLIDAIPDTDQSDLRVTPMAIENPFVLTPEE